MNDDKDQRVTDAIRAGQERGEVITVATIARAAGVGRSYLYRHDGLRARIEAANEDHDTYDKPFGVALSSRQHTLIRQQAKAAGITPGQWIREAAMERAARELGVDPGDLDTVRVRAPRGANSRTAGKEQQS